MVWVWWSTATAFGPVPTLTVCGGWAQPVRRLALQLVVSIIATVLLPEVM